MYIRCTSAGAEHRRHSAEDKDSRTDFAMAQPSLDTLLLTDAEREAARDHVRRMAYFKWQDAGCPENRALEFWCEAELEWMEYFYVPHRTNHQ